MKYIDLSFPAPEKNLACDEALLDACEETGAEEILRLWETDRYFAVVGFSNRVRREVNLQACQKAAIPILRRPSGGGTVLLGPGCLNYSLILKIRGDHPVKDISGTNRYVLERHRKMIDHLIVGAGLKPAPAITVEGTSDLALSGLKFSGNAQRRKRHFLLYHGTFLLQMDLSRVSEYLLMPSSQPGYRQDRSHEDFLTNLNFQASEVKRALKACWLADSSSDPPPLECMGQLIRDKYSKDDWNFKFV